MVDKYLIVGLGNPGKEYAYTRHNLGFFVLRHMAEEEGLTFKQKLGNDGLAAQGGLEGKETILLLPLTYVNNAGVAVKKALREYEIALTHLLVVCDDVHLDFGQLRLRPDGGDGGHNGLTSIITHLKTKSFARLRLGVGAPSKKEEMVNFVLGEFSKEERKKLKDLLGKATQCCLVWLREGMHIAMNQFNRRDEDE